MIATALFALCFFKSFLAFRYRKKIERCSGYFEGFYFESTFGTFRVLTDTNNHHGNSNARHDFYKTINSKAKQGEGFVFKTKFYLHNELKNS